MLLCLSQCGRVLAESVSQTYARLCIRQSDHHKCATDNGDHNYYNGDTYQSAEEKNEVTYSSYRHEQPFIHFVHFHV